MAWPDMRGWSLVGGVNLVVFYYLSSSELWHDKRGGFWWEGPYKKGTTYIVIALPDFQWFF